MRTSLALALTLVACDTAPEPTRFRGDLYENGGPLTDEQVKAVLDACPVEARVWQARQLSAPQPGGVDFRLELTMFTDHPQADCLEGALEKQGIDELETETVFGDYDGPSDTTTTG